MPERLTLGQAAKETGISRQGLWKAAKEGRLVATRVHEARSDVWYVERADLERWLRERDRMRTKESTE